MLTGGDQLALRVEPPYSAPCPVCPAWFGGRWVRKSRKQASANIFQDVELGQMQALFRKSGDENAEERARIIWEKEEQGEQDIAQALMELKSRKTQLFFQHNKTGAEFLGLMWMKAFNRLRIKDGGKASEFESNASLERSQRSKIKRKRLSAKRSFRKLL
ncbi:transcriptional and immune response regulator [Scyliorhinus canicula]|uniref:transcriptional and immune response regulator n=1 Tax=Scyliorhinus canicula TaxID=7830 RepID=UPI0018F446D2|nr:transcriptional and immune response regulator [Scyliorhinus canicula]